MKILYAVSECMPYAATGGLAEVAGSLPKAIKSLKNDARVIMPLYRCVIDNYNDKLTFVSECYVWLKWRTQYCGLYQLVEDGVTYYFIDNKYYFDRDVLYSHYDDGERFAFFSKAIFNCLEMLKFYPDIIHCNDHQTALVSLYLDDLKSQGRFIDTKSVFTIHNIEYQGNYDFAILGDVFDLPEKYRSTVDLSGRINLMKGAILTSDLVTTVSPRYAWEITLPYFGKGLDNVVRDNSFKVVGILNGINTQFYNPRNDKEIYKNYSFLTISEKAVNKESFQKEFGLEVEPDHALMSVISRLVGHKGMDILLARIDEIMAHTVQLVVLGTGDDKYENAFSYYARKYPGRLLFIKAFNTAIAKKLYAASDLFIMPSQTEPCGLSQMICCRYGTLPIVHATGGLYDSITDDIGFRFDNYDDGDLMNAINRALACYYDKDSLLAHIKNAMEKDFSWNASAKVYNDYYKRLVG